jgi:hypothetical protein
LQEVNYESQKLYKRGELFIKKVSWFFCLPYRRQAMQLFGRRLSAAYLDLEKVPLSVDLKGA